MISRIVKVLELPKGCTKTIAAIHVRPKSIFSVIPGREASTLDLVASVSPLIPTLAATIWRFWRRPGAVTAAGVELVLVVSAAANVSATTLPVHGVVGCVA